MLVTENELRKIIKESVEKAINERKYGMDWNDMTPEEQQAYQQSLQKNNWRLFGQKNAFRQGGMTPEDAQTIYNKRRATALKNGGARAGVTAAQAQRLQTSKNNLNSVYSQLGITGPARFGGDLEQQASTKIADLQAKAQELETTKQELATAQETIKKLQGQVSGYAQQIKTLTAQLQQPQQPAAQPRPANPQLAQVNKTMVQNPTTITPPTQQMAKA